MNDDLVAKLRAVKVRTPEEVMAKKELALDESCKKGLGIGALDDWITYWQGVEGKTLASMPDYYSWFKELKKLQKYELEHVAELLSIFREESSSYSIGVKDFSKWLVTSTLVTYSRFGLEAEITHHYSNLKLERRFRVDSVNMLYDADITSVLPVSYDFFKTLFGTEDSAEEIIKTLEFAGGVSQDNILVKTLLARKVPDDELSHRVAAFSFYNSGQFVISATDFTTSEGYSRGVSKDE